MRTFTVIIVVFIALIMFFEITDWTPTVPTTTQVTKEKTVVVETVDETGEIVNTTITKSTTETEEDR